MGRNRKSRGRIRAAGPATASWWWTLRRVETTTEQGEIAFDRGSLSSREAVATGV